MNYCNYVRRFTTSMKLAAISHYDALGVTPKATQTEIKSAYYNLSKVYHPDKNQGSAEAATKFRDITAAYEVLGNVRLRKLYDKGIDIKGSTSTYQHSYKDDPALKFYKSREQRSRPPGTGRTPFYDFDEWSRLHYGQTFAQDMHRKHSRQARKEEREMFQRQNKVDDKSYDKDVYIKQEGKNSAAKPQ